MKYKIFLIFAMFFFIISCSGKTIILTYSDIEKMAEDIIMLLSERQFDEVRKYFDAKMTSAYSSEKLEEIWEKILQRYGNLKEIISKETKLVENENVKSFIVFVICKTDMDIMYKIRVFFDKNAKVSGLWYEDYIE